MSHANEGSVYKCALKQETARRHLLTGDAQGHAIYFLYWKHVDVA